MIYISEVNGIAMFTAYQPDGDYFMIDRYPDCPYQHDSNPYPAI